MFIKRKLKKVTEYSERKCKIHARKITTLKFGTMNGK